MPQTKPDRRIAGALALLLCANMALVLVCELRCDVPAPATTSNGACHGTVSMAATSESPFTVADGGRDQCAHDALPAVTIAGIKKDVRVTVDALTVSTQIAEPAPALTCLARTDRSASVRDHHSTRTVLRI